MAAMSEGRPLTYAVLGPLPGGRSSLGVAIYGHGRPAEPVGLVWVPGALAANPAELDELRADTHEAERLKHPHLVGVRGLERLEEGWARVVDWADAEPLRKLLDKADRADIAFTGLVARIVAAACEGVHHAHEVGEGSEARRPILHGGLRPEVLLVDFRGRTKVSGYGAARLAPQASDSVRDAFTAPEQVLGGKAAMTRATDVYALGAVLYACLTGEPPFAGQGAALERAILSAPPDPLPLHGHATLGPVILKALSKRAVDRFPTADAFGKALLAAEGLIPASQLEVARWVNGLVPHEDPDRDARRRLIASAAVTTGETLVPEEGPLEELQLSAPQPAPQPSAPAPVPAPVAPPTPRSAAAEPTRAAPAPQRPRPMTEESPVPAEGVPFVGVLAFLATSAAIGGLALQSHRAREAGLIPDRFAQMRDAGAPVVDAGPVDAGTPEVDAGALAPDAGPAPMDAGTSAAVAPTPVVAPSTTGSPTAPAPNPAPATAGTAAKFPVEITTAPPMELRIDGQKVGQGDVTVQLTAGRHRLEATEAKQRLKVSRELVVAGPMKEEVELQKARLSFDVPVGALVAVDGKPLGTAPLQPIELWEGTHEVTVEMEGTESVQKVPLVGGVDMTFTVRAHAE